MIAVKDLSRAQEFYGGKLGLTAIDERPGAVVRYETREGTWFLVYRSQFAGTAKSTCMRFEVENIEVAVEQLRDHGIVFEEYDLPGVKTVEGIAEHESGARGVVQGSRRKHPPARPARQVIRPPPGLGGLVVLRQRRSRGRAARCSPISI